METTFLYVLTDPVTGSVRYLGKSNNPFKRLKRHLLDSSPSHKKNWIDSLKSAGMAPNMELLDEVPVSQWQFWEREYIRVFKAIGLSLTNQCEGGENPPSRTGTARPPFSSEWRAKIAASRRGKPTRLGVKNSLETRAKISASKLGRPVPESVLLAAISANTGKKRSEEFGLKIVRAQTGFTRAATGQFKRMPYFSDGGGI